MAAGKYCSCVGNFSWEKSKNKVCDFPLLLLPSVRFQCGLNDGRAPSNDVGSVVIFDTSSPRSAQAADWNPNLPAVCVWFTSLSPHTEIKADMKNRIHEDKILMGCRWKFCFPRVKKTRQYHGTCPQIPPPPPSPGLILLSRTSSEDVLTFRRECKMSRYNWDLWLFKYCSWDAAVTSGQYPDKIWTCLCCRASCAVVPPPKPSIIHLNITESPHNVSSHETNPAARHTGPPCYYVSGPRLAFCLFFQRFPSNAIISLICVIIHTYFNI